MCDGVSEGNFPDVEVVKLAAEVLAKASDPVAAANAVVYKAVEVNSKDSVTCMMGEVTDPGVQLSGKTDITRVREWVEFQGMRVVEPTHPAYPGWGNGVLRARRSP